MAAGAPIVASDLDAFRRVLRGGRAGELFERAVTVGLAARRGPAAGRPGPARRVLSRSPPPRRPWRDYDWKPWWPRDVLQVYEAVVPVTRPPGSPVS